MTTHGDAVGRPVLSPRRQLDHVLRDGRRMNAGIHDGIPAGEYHADPGDDVHPSLSSSIANILLTRSPVARVDEPPETQPELPAHRRQQVRRRHRRPQPPARGDERRGRVRLPRLAHQSREGTPRHCPAPPAASPCWRTSTTRCWGW